MIVTDVECIMLRLPEVKPIADGTQDTLLVKVHTDAGIVGIGEGHTSPWVLKAIIEAPMSGFVARGLREILVGQDPLDVRPLWDRMYAYTMHYGRRGALIQAISAIDIALWDILGKATGQPVWRLLGGAYRREIPTYASALSPETPAAAVELARDLVDRGFPAVKLGWGGLGADLKADVKLVADVRRAVGDGVDLMVDVGVPMPLRQAIDFSLALRDSNVLFLEEPLSPDDLAGYAELRAAGGVQIACGEKETTRFGFRDLIERGRPHVLQPDVGRAGGFTECQRIADLAGLSRTTVVPHCWSTDVLVAATTHFIASLPDCPYLEYCVVDNPIRNAVVREPIRSIDGVVAVPDRPGLGVELNEATIERFRYA